jgi:aquaporin Z
MNKYVSEFIGTFFLVLAGTGAIIVNDVSGGQITHIGIALTFGLVVMAMIYSIGNISGAHLNPAVTLGFLVSGRLDKKQALPFMGSQFFGALTASLILRLLFADHNTLGITVPSGSVAQTFILEIILSFLLMFVILNVSTGAKEKGIMAGVAVGSTIALEALFAGPITGASMNPARSFAPALISGHLEYVWIYLIAPVIGALAACPFCRIIQGVECCPSLETKKGEAFLP